MLARVGFFLTGPTGASLLKDCVRLSVVLKGAVQLSWLLDQPEHVITALWNEVAEVLEEVHPDG